MPSHIRRVSVAALAASIGVLVVGYGSTAGSEPPSGAMAAEPSEEFSGDTIGESVGLGAEPAAVPVLRNIGLASNRPLVYGDRIVFRVPEIKQGGADLNLDGDARDGLLHVYDSASGRTVNLGLAGMHVDIAEVGRPLPLLVEESEQHGRDLNGDGDARDEVLHLYDPVSGTSVNVGLALGFLELDGGRVAVAVDEFAQGERDLNGDGDTEDRVLHLYDVVSGATVNVGLAVIGSVSFDLEGDLVAARVHESDQGQTDLNGDGDDYDDVLFVVNAANGATVNVGLSVDEVLLENGRVIFEVEEYSQHADLDGDGDIGDESVLHVYDVASGTTVNTGLTRRSGILSFVAEGDLVAVTVSESPLRDLNGDGDKRDEDVLHLYNALNGQVTNLQLAAAYDAFELAGGRVAFQVEEAAQGRRDLNGDGDTRDRVLHIYDRASGDTRNLRVALQYYEFNEAQLLAYQVSEAGQGRRDLNGDGDAQDRVLHVLDPLTRIPIGLGLATPTFQPDGKRVAFLVNEKNQGKQDLNGDGDTHDGSVLHLYDAISGATLNLGVADRAPPTYELAGDLVAISVSEARQGARDLNGDHDRNDIVLHVYTTGSDEDRSSALAPTLRERRTVGDRCSG